MRDCKKCHYNYCRINPCELCSPIMKDFFKQLNIVELAQAEFSKRQKVDESAELIFTDGYIKGFKKGGEI